MTLLSQALKSFYKSLNSFKLFTLSIFYSELELNNDIGNAYGDEVVVKSTGWGWFAKSKT